MKNGNCTQDVMLRKTERAQNRLAAQMLDFISKPVTSPKNTSVKRLYAHYENISIPRADAVDEESNIPRQTIKGAS